MIINILVWLIYPNPHCYQSQIHHYVSVVIVSVLNIHRFQRFVGSRHIWTQPIVIKRTKMKHEVITLPEKHQDYPVLWYSDCKFYRIVRCSDNIQYILQRFSRPDWRGFSYHVEWSSIVYRFGGLHTYHNMPSESPEGCSHSGKATLLAVPA